MMTHAGLLIRLAATGLPRSPRGLDRRIVLAVRRQPRDGSSAPVLHEDRKLAARCLDVEFPVTPTTLGAFARVLADWGVDIDAVAETHALKPDLVGETDPSAPHDRIRLPQVRLPRMMTS